jgi:hypothetical protein
LGRGGPEPRRVGGTLLGGPERSDRPEDANAVGMRPGLEIKAIAATSVDLDGD